MEKYMAPTTHTLGFPRIGVKRELKQALEQYWAGTISASQLLDTGRTLRQRHWQWQAEAGIDLLPVGDFAWYDQVLGTSLLLGNIPARHRDPDGHVDLDTLFRIARGRAPTGHAAAASEMSKWFNTNYHYLVPEFSRDQSFSLEWSQLFDEVAEAQALGHTVKPVLLGPLSYLWLGKVKGEPFDRLELLPQLINTYAAILTRLAAAGCDWVQIDEPALVLDLPENWQRAYQSAYAALQGHCRLLLTSYFGPVDHHWSLIQQLPVQGLHLDCVAGHWPSQAQLATLPDDWVISLGIINGRNIWRADLQRQLRQLTPLAELLRERLWLGSSCSLLHCPLDLQEETTLDHEARSWLAFARQKCVELNLLAQALGQGEAADIQRLQAYSAPIQARATSTRVHNPAVQVAVATITPAQAQRQSGYPQRAAKQRLALQLPAWPTTTIGSFPQTRQIRALRQDYKQGRLSREAYEHALQQEIAFAVREQEALNLDVLVHGEPERNDMVEYFGEQLDGYLFTRNGWVQSYGSRCVKPPIISGDISRPHPITVAWSQYAQSLTRKPMKGMLTGPLTMLCWSFLREDLDRQTIARQLALALRDEVCELEQAGIKIIQIDEPALREGLPLRQAEWSDYLQWAVQAFQLTAAGVQDETQIHTHMCYCEFSDVMDAIAALDADVITLETSRSDMELLETFRTFAYPNEIGPGVYDIHSPNVPSIEWMASLLRKAAEHIPAERLWVNPDCGLKTRGWEETRAALANMVIAAKQLRHERRTQQ
jgi:5-methyltetrahydropteroyltriglutamate--homocysteine methyltransferase